MHNALRLEAHIEAECETRLIVDGPRGRWYVSAFATSTHFYAAQAQVWHGENGDVCVIHGLIWRVYAGSARLLDAAQVAALTTNPDRGLPEDIGGEYCIVRLHASGVLTAFSDAAGLHQLFHRPDMPKMVASRAGFLAALARDWNADADSGAALTALGYRIGSATGWRGVSQVPPGLIFCEGTLIPDGNARLLPAKDAPRGLATVRAKDLMQTGICQAKALIHLIAGDGELDLPITGGKDSRAVLALCLSAGLRDRLRLSTRGADGHPDVEVGRLLASHLGIEHHRQEPRSVAQDTDWNAADLHKQLARHAYQTDGGMGGWDVFSADQCGTQTFLTGHMGELLKGYAKRPDASAGKDPIAMVRQQGPFDPLGIVRENSRNAIVETILQQMHDGHIQGVPVSDDADLFYLRNRIPNWLGGVRGVKSFERQPVMPLGVPAFLRLAWCMTASERQAEQVHYHLIRTLAPALVDVPFAHQQWPSQLTGAPVVAPLLAPAEMPLLGNWQYVLNRDPGIRRYLAALFARHDVALWAVVDRDRVQELLVHRHFDYFDAISLLALTTAVLHAAGDVRRDKLRSAVKPVIAHQTVEPASRRPVHPTPSARVDPWPDEPILLRGHIDGVGGMAKLDAQARLLVTGEGIVTLGGWAVATAWPGTQPTLVLRADSRVIATTRAESNRPDLKVAGIGNGRHGFTFRFDTSSLREAKYVEVGLIGADASFDGGRLAIAR